YGQGISRPVGNVCYVISAGHVVRPIGGKVKLTTPSGVVEGTVLKSEPPPYDIGVVSATNSTPCSDSSWQDGSSVPQTLRQDSGTLRTMGSDGTVTNIPVLVKRVGDLEIEIVPAHAGTQLLEGQSGSPLWIKDSLAGLLVTVAAHDGEYVGTVLRQDFVNRFLGRLWDSLKTNNNAADSLAKQQQVAEQMRARYDELTTTIDKASDLTTAGEAALWKEFLEQYSLDLPYVSTDDEVRKLATSRLRILELKNGERGVLRLSGRPNGVRLKIGTLTATLDSSETDFELPAGSHSIVSLEKDFAVPERSKDFTIVAGEVTKLPISLICRKGHWTTKKEKQKKEYSDTEYIHDAYSEGYCEIHAKTEKLKSLGASCRSDLGTPNYT